MANKIYKLRTHTSDNFSFTIFILK